MSDYKLQTTFCAGRMSKIRHPTDALWMSNIRHSIGRASDVEYSTFD